MRRPFRIIVLFAGTLLGYGFAFHAMHDHHLARMSFEQHVADLCVDAARKQRAATASEPSAPELAAGGERAHIPVPPPAAAPAP